MKKITIITIMMLTSMLLSAEIWSVYHEVTSDYTVDPGSVLIIEPGTTVRFEHNSALIVQGQLIAIGNDQEPIRFTSLEPTYTGNDYWRGIEFYNSGALEDSSYMHYCTIDNIDKLIAGKASQEGSISGIESVLSLYHNTIHSNKAIRGGGFNFNSCAVNLISNEIMNNKAQLEGGGIYICNTESSGYDSTIVKKNIIIENEVYQPEYTNRGGGGIAVFDPVRYPNIIKIHENDIINNKVTLDQTPSGAGGGFCIFQGPTQKILFAGNKIMYNNAKNAGGVYVEFTSSGDESGLFLFHNNIIANNSGDNYGGAYFNTGQIPNPEAIQFFNNNFTSNENVNGSFGAGGLTIEHSYNYFPVKNCIFWHNKISGETYDLATEPYLPFSDFAYYNNSTYGMDGSNIQELPLFRRAPDVNTEYGATPYDNYIRWDFHLSLLSKLIDAGDEELGMELNGTPPNIGAWGLTNEATTSNYEYELYQGATSVFVEQGQTFLLDCFEYTEQIILEQLIIQDGGQFFFTANNSTPVIKIDYLEIQGQKIGDQYTTKFQRESTENDEYLELPYNVLQIGSGNCSGIEFSQTGITFTSSDPTSLTDSKIYLIDYNDNLNGIELTASTDFVIENNIIDNFGCGINLPELGKASRTGRITNNTVSFDSESASKDKATAKKGIVVKNANNVDIENNDIDNPDDGIEMSSSSSGRITNNTVSFDSEPASKDATLSRAIYVSNCTDIEITNNTIISTDIVTSEIRGIEIDTSSVVASYNVIDFNEYNPSNTYTGFFTSGLGTNTRLINNTINNADFGLYNISSGEPTEFINNLVWGAQSGHLECGEYPILLAYNNDITGDYLSACLDENNNYNEDPVYKSAKISDFYLDDTSNMIDAGLYVDGFHEYGVNFYGDKPDVGAIEFYVAVSLNSPSNINISATSSIASISWNSVQNANSYKVYRSTDPYGTYSLYTSTSSTSYDIPTSGLSKYFYYIVASTDSVGKVEDEIELTKETITITKPKVKILKKANESSNR